MAITENAGYRWKAGGGWRIDSVPELIIGATHRSDIAAASGDGGSSGISLQRVEAVRVLGDGRIVVADGGLGEVMVFDSTGTLTSRFVGQGRGPGELPEIMDTYVCGGDSIAVLGRFEVLIFDSQGGFARQEQYRSGGQQGTVKGVSADCSRLLVQQRASMPPIHTTGYTQDVLAWQDPRSGATDTITTARFLDVWTRRFRGVQRPFVIPWGTSPDTHAFDEGRLVVGYGRIPELRRYGPSGQLESIIRWPARRDPITRADRQRYSDLRAEWFAGMPEHPETRYLFPALDDYPSLPEEKPLFDRVLVDDDRRLWVRRFAPQSLGLFDARLPEPTASEHVWMVFDSTGVWLGEIEVPGRFNLAAAARGRLLGVARDSMDVQTVAVYRLHTGLN
ncbi:MAG TPA: hypothetical protein VFI91_09400 [Longimicrobiaceae bacterium]|nr:hypothetical protein [Longimicrobiaceae bacterium]